MLYRQCGSMTMLKKYNILKQRKKSPADIIQCNAMNYKCICKNLHDFDYL